MRDFVVVLQLLNPDGVQTTSMSPPYSYLVCQMEKRRTRTDLQAALAEKGVRIVSLECEELTTR